MMVCKNCGHQTPILFCERTNSVFSKALSATEGVDGVSSRGYRKYSYTSGGSKVTKEDRMPIKVFEETTLTIKAQAYRLLQSGSSNKETFNVYLYKVNEDGSLTTQCYLYFVGRSRYNNDSNTMTCTLTPGEYRLVAYYKSLYSGSSNNIGGHYWIPEYLTY